MRKPVLVTGGCGFVGRHLVKKLIEKGESIYIVDNLFIGKHPDEWLPESWQKKRTETEDRFTYTLKDQQIVFIKGDALEFFIDLINSRGKYEVPKFSDLFHLASIVGGRALIDGDPLLISYDLAIDAAMFTWATRNKDNVERVLYASSSAAYPVNLQTKEKALALKEEYIKFGDILGQPDMTYGWTKLTGEYTATLAHQKYGLHVACIRPFSGYGEDQDLTYPTPSIALRVARHDNPIEVWGTGEQGRDFIHIDDCVDAMFVVLDKVSDGRGINIGSGKLTSFNQLIKLMCKLEGHDAKIKRLLDKPVGVQSRYCDTTILNKEIGWKPAISLEEGMQRMLDFAKTRIKSAIITTTINVPLLLENYVKNVIDNKHNCFFVIIGDKKTPLEAKDYCNSLAKKYKIEIAYLDVEDQKKYLARYPELNEHLVYNSIQRRNIGLLYAYEKGAEKIITIDDDNFFIKDDFVSLHEISDSKEVEILSSKTGWFNVCSVLEDEKNRPFYHRGFPLEERFRTEKISTEKKDVKVVVNAGFWLGDPDIDAMTRLYYLNDAINVTGYTRKSNFALAKGTWSPFNSQNTVLAREVIPAYFLSPYIGRYDDIWASYVVKKITDHLNHYIVFGDPLVKQERNIHNYWKDLAKEDMGMSLTKRFTDMLIAIKLTGSDYKECYKELTLAMEAKLSENASEYTQEQLEYIQKYIEGMNVWIITFDKLG